MSWGPARGMGHGGDAKGEGWGGEPSGEGWKPGDPIRPGHGRPKGVKTGEGKKARARAMLEDAAELGVMRVINVALDDKDPRNLTAALSILNRVGLHEKAGVEVGGDPEQPVRVERIIVRPGDKDA